MGFLPLLSTEVPEAVRNQSKYIYKLTMPYYAEVESGHYQELLASKISDAAKNAVSRCSEKGSKSCWIPFSHIRGTAFLEGEGKSLWTNCHIVHSWIRYQVQELSFAGVQDQALLQKLFASNVPAVIEDLQGNQIDASGDLRPLLLAAAVMKGRSEPKGLECSLMDDAVKLRLQRPLAANGLIRRSGLPSPSEGQALFIGGFPRPTESRAARGGIDSDGNSFYFAKGPFLSKGGEAYQELFRTRDSLGLALNGPYSQVLLSDSAEGMSGGPVLDEHGNLLGIYKGFLPLDSKARDLPLVSLYLELGALRYVEIFTEGLGL